MAKLRICTVFGTRPEILKLSKLIEELDKDKKIKHSMIFTGQHFDWEMAEVFFKELKLREPDYWLERENTGKLAKIIKQCLKKIKPQVVIVQGDTSSALAGARAAFALGIPVAHIEAGCRSYSERIEEANRKAIDLHSAFLFCSDQYSVDCLEKEGFPWQNVFLVGRPLFEILETQAKHLKTQSFPKSLQRFVFQKGDFVLFTMHRGETLHNPARLKELVDTINTIAKYHPVVFPVHPHTRQVLDKENIKFDLDVLKIEPLGYKDFLKTLSECLFVITDSGGVQEEAAFFEKKCFVLMEQTEWVELLGNNVLCGYNKKEILGKIVRSLSEKRQKTRLPVKKHHTALQIIDILIKILKKTRHNKRFLCKNADNTASLMFYNLDKKEQKHLLYCIEQARLEEMTLTMPNCLDLWDATDELFHKVGIKKNQRKDIANLKRENRLP